MNITGAGSKTAPGMIGFYQSFEYQNSFNIILEYADEDTLEDFFMKKDPPMSSTDALHFWRSLFEIVKGICVLHRQQLESENQPYSGGRGDGGASLQGYVLPNDIPISVLLISMQMASRFEDRKHLSRYQSQRKRLSMEVQDC